MQLTHLGHACLLVEIDDVRVLFDPGVFSSGFEQLTDLTAVLVTH
jgi:L-ascorbate metabolism protein UlaG (beta-lactamase superfamily)